MNRLFKIFLLVAFSVFVNTNLSANDTFFSIEKSSERIEDLAEGVDDILTKLLKNSDYKKFYDDLVSGVSPRKFPNELTLKEEAIYKFYTNKTYYKFNEALILGNKTDDIVELEKLFNNTLDKLPSSPGTRYRGIGKSEIDKLIEIGENGTVKYDNFLSTTSEKEKAWEFFNNNLDKTKEAAFVDVISKNGKSIEKYSDATEWEFLHKSGTEFNIKKIEIEKDYILNIDDVIDYGDAPKKIDLIKIVLEEL